MTITEFLEARIAEDEADAQHALVGPHKTAVPWVGVFRVVEDFDGGTAAEAASPWLAAHIARHDPARVLAECAAKRAVVKSYQSCQSAEASYDIRTETGVKLVASGMVKGMELAVKYLAATYHTHPEYERDWADETIRSMRDHEVIPRYSDSGQEK